jgi:hypothetical protein
VPSLQDLTGSLTPVVTTAECRADHPIIYQAPIPLPVVADSTKVLIERFTARACGEIPYGHRWDAPHRLQLDALWRCRVCLKHIKVELCHRASNRSKVDL